LAGSFRRSAWQRYPDSAFEIVAFEFAGKTGVFASSLPLNLPPCLSVKEIIMILTSKLRTAFAMLALAASASLQAHHGVAAYDVDASVTVRGVVEAFEWGNPHALIRLRGADDARLVWTAETAGLVILSRAGWSKETLKPGDECTLIGHAARNGSPNMILRRAVLADGRELTNYVP
jgi:hypothetical protein